MYYQPGLVDPEILATTDWGRTLASSRPAWAWKAFISEQKIEDGMAKGKALPYHT